jgi:hypothetical protein
LARRNRLQRIQDRTNQGQQVFDLICSRTNQNDGELPADRTLLAGDALIDGY